MPLAIVFGAASYFSKQQPFWRTIFSSLYGYIYFDETLSMKEQFGIAFALISLFLIHSKEER